MWFTRLLVISAMLLTACADPLKVVCWNIHHGVGEDGRLDLERIAKVIEMEKPDLVALQEVDNRCGRSGKVDQAAELGRLLGMQSVFGKAMDFGGGGYGLAVLSKLPIKGQKVHRLPGGGEPRIAFEVMIGHPEGNFSFVNVHLDHQGEERQRLQAEELDRQLKGVRSVILCGDFNADPSSKTMKVFEKWELVPKKGARFTQPAGAPTVEIDHVLLRGFQSPMGARVIEEAVASDHRPLALTVEPS
ncbi:endonuclease/exonuclease/phosphatase family protein [Haloferula rosea]|uniref:Endonuclease/exonuclease/phosphatase family protein n=1 Tax=Haloferula rosea TaxID=490093 RepID=A0A934VFW2_9BACT|nr:endonuclease/exonuclease/phosphatase family protein [Haloferula rosea]MBK1827461.1 endonuclease/exonuclease/phosphatase family protein [Haloferula rosea]